MPVSITLNQQLREEYERLFNGCRARPERETSVERLADRVLGQQSRYQAVSALSAVPWQVIAAVHAMEAGLRFDRHLHNGDPLHSRTRRVPPNRPPGNPPFSWEESALDALRHDGLTGWSDWSLAGTLFRLEGYNGWGYRKFHADVLSPYLWSFSNHYTKGKYASDGTFDPDLVSRQCGIGPLLKVLEQRGHARFDEALPEPLTVPEADAPPYPGRQIRQGDPDAAIVRLLQRRLNELGSANPPLLVDGDFGSKTEAAVRMFQARSEDSGGEPLVIDGVVGSLTWEALFGEAALPRVHVRPSQAPLLASVLQVARDEIGIEEQPPGSNGGPRVEQYLGSTGLGGGHPWCAAFVFWCFQQGAERLGTDNPCINTAGVLDHWNRAGREGIRRITHAQAEEDPQLVQPGMIFVIDTGDPGGAGHTGIVERVEGGKLVTIEGNTNVAGSREGIGVFRRNGRKVLSINKGFIDYARALG